MGEACDVEQVGRKEGRQAGDEAFFREHQEHISQQ